jgi:glycosyltransferase involved in cell wall biosynthesis
MSGIRVVHVITRLIVGGAQENTLLSCARIDRDRFPSTIVVGPQTGSEGALFDEARAESVPVVIEPTLVRELHPLYDPIVVARLVAHFRRLRADIVHTHTAKAGIVGRIAARLAGVRHVVHTVHGWPFSSHRSGPARTFYVWADRVCAPLTDKMVVVADQDRREGLAYGIGRPDQYMLVRSGIEIERYAAGRLTREATRHALGFGADDFVFGYVGRLSPQKSPLDLVAAFAPVARAHPQARLLVVGDGPLRADFEAALERLGVRERVLLLGVRRDVPALLGACDAFVLSSIYEGLPRVVPQAMALALPVVATACNGTPEAVWEGETGFLTPPGDPAAMSRGMMQLIADPARARAMGAAGARRVTEFSAAHMVAQLAALYAELTGGQGARSAVGAELRQESV